jgi:predicted MFS family arabinose efflux permease
MATFLNRVTSAVMASSCLSLATFLTWPGFFFFLAFICVLVYIFYYVYLPETKGKSLEEMNKYFVEITGNGTVVEAEMRPKPVHDSEIS